MSDLLSKSRSKLQGHLNTMKRSVRELCYRVGLNDWDCDTSLCCNVLCCLPLSSSSASRPATTKRRLPPRAMNSQAGDVQPAVGKLTKVLLVGSSGIGKTSLARTIADGAFPTANDMAQFIHSNEAVTIKYKSTSKTAFKFGDCRDCYYLELKEVICLNPDACPAWDDMQGTHLVFLCFDITNPTSFDAIRELYYPHISKELHGKKLMPDTILVGLKEDEKGNTPKDVQPITPAVANQLADQIGAQAYVETSALKNIGIELLKEKTVFNHMVKTKRHQEKTHESRCSFL